MVRSEKRSSDLFREVEKDTKEIAKTGPAGIILATMIIIGVLAIIILAFMLLGSKD